VYSPENTH